MTFEQVQAMLKVFKAHLPQGQNRFLHVGVMMSYKTLHDIETKWSKAFPAKEAIAGIFGSDDVYNCLHYADYDHNSNLGNTLARAISYGGIGINAMQLDMIWPDPGQVAHGIHTSRRHIEVILQVGKNAIEEANDDPQTVVQRLEDYDGVIHRVLLDKSMGRGLDMDAVALLPFARAIKERFPGLGLTVAGGLGPNTMHLVEPLVAEFPDLSIDAQGKLRPSGSALDPIDWDMAGEYLTKALSMLK
ncbi:MAG: hypothetical protein ACYC1Y_03700 [Minisyncoccota bacterium]